MILLFIWAISNFLENQMDNTADNCRSRNPDQRQYASLFQHGASAVPLQIMEKCAEGIALAGQYAAKGSVLAVSDAGCAAVLCKAALQAASLNVFINTKLMADRTRAAALDARADALLAEFVHRADEIFTAVSGKLRNK